ncbi:MAG: glycosyltransferase [Coriobacteriia bacterium]|nr:glycosyltransferase [Coriobacteriia bacterium]
MSGQKFTVGVLIAAFNAENTLARAVASLKRQTEQSWLAVIVDDGSTDSTLDVATEQAANSDQILVIRQENQGAGAARNFAESHLPPSINWCMSLDADDELVPEGISLALDGIRSHPSMDILFYNAWMLDEEGNRRPWVTGEREHVVNFEEMLKQSKMLGSGTLFSRARFQQVGGYSDGYVEDYELWLRMLRAGSQALYIPEFMYIYSAYGEQRKTSSSEVTAHATAEVLRDMINSGELSKVQIAAASAHLERCYYAVHLEDQRETLLRLLSRIIGQKYSLRALNALHLLARPFLPLRKVLAKRASDR